MSKTFVGIARWYSYIQLHEFCIKNIAFEIDLPVKEMNIYYLSPSTFQLNMILTISYLINIIIIADFTVGCATHIAVTAVEVPATVGHTREV